MDCQSDGNGIRKYGKRGGNDCTTSGGRNDSGRVETKSQVERMQVSADGTNVRRVGYLSPCTTREVYKTTYLGREPTASS